MKKILILTFILLLCGCSSELACSEGVLEDGKCKVVLESEPTLSCKSGYTYSEEKEKCVNTLTIDAKQVSICPNGFEIGNDVWCYSEKRYDKETTRECVSEKIEEDDTLSSTYEKDNVCYEKICTEKNEDGTECITYVENKIDYKETTACPKGTVSIKGECRKKQWMTKKYSCEIGEMVDKKCIISDEIDKEYVCPSGYVLNSDNNICQKTEYIDAQ